MMKLLKKLSLVLAAVMAVTVGGFAVGCAPADEGDVNNPPIEKPDDGNPDETPGGENPGGENPGGDEELQTHDLHSLLQNDGTALRHNIIDDDLGDTADLLAPGRCEYCGYETGFRQTPLMRTDYLLEPISNGHAGTVEKFEYNTKAYFLQEAEGLTDEQAALTKTAYVYLPYGYDPADTETKYELLILVHGSGLDETYWFAQGYTDENGVQIGYVPEDNNYTGGFGTMNVLDKMMDSGMAKKTIVVTPTFYGVPEWYKEENNIENNEQQNGLGNIPGNFGHELINDLLPALAKEYNTYAEVTDDMTADEIDAELKANRDHQAYAGLSMGSMTSFSSVWTYCLEYFAYVGSYSGGGGSQEIVDNYNQNYSDCEIKYWYVGYGSAEGWQSAFESFMTMKEGVGLTAGLEDPEANCDFVLSNRTAHNYATWITCLYNTMQVFFQR